MTTSLHAMRSLGPSLHIAYILCVSGSWGERREGERREGEEGERGRGGGGREGEGEEGERGRGRGVGEREEGEEERQKPFLAHLESGLKIHLTAYLL